MMPTIVNNVETVSNLPHILDMGVDAYKALGHEADTGTFMFSVSGHVNKPGNYELPHGITWRELIYDIAGGVARRPRAEDVDPRWRLRPVVRSRRPPRPRDHQGRHRQGRVDARLRCRGRHGRHHLCDPGGRAGGAVLRPRVVRPVHTLSGGHHLARDDPASHRERAGPSRSTSTCCSTSPTTSRSGWPGRPR
jgi:hypothetical protein